MPRATSPPERTVTFASGTGWIFPQRYSSAPLVDVDGQVGITGDQGAGRGGVVEVDVGEQDRLGARVAELLQQRVEGGLGPGIDEHSVDLPAGDHVRASEVLDVDGAHRGED
jgi:hypothetical protein